MIKYEFTAKVWQHSAPGGWYFVSLPIPYSKEVREIFKSEEAGWGRLKATATIGTSTWKTAIWFDTKKSTYLLPLKAGIRKTEGIRVEKEIRIVISI